ncbi:hypothetical protein DRO60_02925 [Candidatus Bathyarchaeota archaeon]|nr:MAG: hypothetical protein DRO60_02925 [Candidatus Bathyarchaeota archaeon]
MALRFVALLRLYSASAARDHVPMLKRIASVEPPPGVRVIGAFCLLGAYDGLVLFEAQDMAAAREFVNRILARGIYRVDVMGAIPVGEL